MLKSWAEDSLSFIDDDGANPNRRLLAAAVNAMCVLDSYIAMAYKVMETTPVALARPFRQSMLYHVIGRSITKVF